MLRHSIHAALVAAFLFSGCAVMPAREPKLPLSACVVTCPAGYAIRLQHLCRGDRRWLRDVTAHSRHTVRGVDGAVVEDTYITDQGDFAVVDVVLTSCSSFIRSAVQSRSISERGVHPGEPDPTTLPPTPRQ